MTANRTCPECQTPLPADAPAGLCPRCLLQRGLGSDTSGTTTGFGPFAPPSVDELRPLFPQLEIIELLGQGGMGAVYKARQPGLDRLVALKILPPAADASFAERFTREARTLAKLNHPGIVTVFDFGQAGGLYYFVMEFVEGVNLRQAQQAHKLTPPEALAIVPKICEALQVAHDAGVVHRDIKPENILLDAKGRVKIADFGLAKLLNRSAEQSHLTHTNQAMGTMHYMAPEQWEKPQTVDHRADIYSLGVVFYELLTGELPLGRFAPPSQKVQIDVRLDDIVLRTLEKEPDRRYQHASDVKTDVERIGGTTPPPSVSLAATPIPSLSRHVGWPILGLALLWLGFMVNEGEPYKTGSGTIRRGENAMVAAPLAIVLCIAAPIAIAVFLRRWWVSRRQKPIEKFLIDGLRGIPAFLPTPQTWVWVVSLLGVVNAFMPWVDIGIPDRKWITINATATHYSPIPTVTAALFLMIAVFHVFTAMMQRFQLARAIFTLSAGVVLSGLPMILFEEAATYPTEAMTRELRQGILDRTNSPEIYIVKRTIPGFSMAFGAALLVLGMVELAAHIKNCRTKDEKATKPATSQATVPQFLPSVLWPVLALAAVAVGSAGVAMTESFGSFRGPAQIVNGFSSLLVPMVFVVLMIRWMWLTLRPQRPVLFWVFCVGLILVLALGYSVAVAVILMRGGDTPISERDQVDSRQQLLIGTWEDDDGRTIEFRKDGTFEEREANGFLLMPALFAKSGQYHWRRDDPKGERIVIKTKGYIGRGMKVVFDGDILTLLEDDGSVHRMKRKPHEPAEALIGVWEDTTATKGVVGRTFRADGTFEHRFPSGSLTAGQYHWHDAHHIELGRPGESENRTRYKVVIDGDTLTLLDEKGGVHRMKRGK